MIQDAPGPVSLSRDLVEYPSRMHYITILGELVGDSQIRRHTKGQALAGRDDLGRRNDTTNDASPSDLDTMFLESKGAFTLPAKELR